MNRLRFLQIALLVTISLTISGCSQTQLNKLDGSWRLFWLNNLSDPNIYIWTFSEGELTVTMYEPSLSPLTPAEVSVGGRAQYKTNTQFLGAVIEISGYEQSISHARVNEQLHNGDWTIAKINNEVMRIAHRPDAGGYEIREFTREE